MDQGAKRTMNLLPWNRSVKLGDPSESLIEVSLKKCFPQDQFPRHIEVVRGQMQTSPIIWIRDGRGRKISGVAYPQNFVTNREPMLDAVMSRVMELANHREVASW